MQAKDSDKNRVVLGEEKGGGGGVSGVYGDLAPLFCISKRGT